MEIETAGVLSTPFPFFELKQIHSEARDEAQICNRLYIVVLIIFCPGISDLLERNGLIS
jgi:hypothetical protein